MIIAVYEPINKVFMCNTVEFRFFEYSIIRNSRFFEPKVVSLGFPSVKHCNFTPDFSNARFFETPGTSIYFFHPLKNLHSISRTLKTLEPTKPILATYTPECN